MTVRILQGDCRNLLKTLPDCSVHCCVTSPPYFGLRDYGIDGQMGLEKTPDDYVQKLVSVFDDVRRVLRDDGTLWLNLGDSYAGSMKGIGADGKAYAGAKQATNKGAVGIFHERPPSAAQIGLKPKDLIGIPWRVAFALQESGWYLRSDIIWHKPNPMPESVTDRPTKAHEYIFLLSKSPTYFYDAEAIREEQTASSRVRAKYAWRGCTDDGSNGARGGSTFKRTAATGEKIGTIPADGKRNKRSVWTVGTHPFRGAHFATFPTALIEPCILAGCPKDGTVLDPFGGAGTTGLVAERLQRNALLIELNPRYAVMAEERIHSDAPMFIRDKTA
jgi:DNA modification methylase